MRTRIIDCQIFDPANAASFNGYVEFENGVITAVGKGKAAAAGKDVVEINGGGNCLVPSFVDLYANFCEPGHEHREDIASGSRAAAAGGYTAVCLRPDTDPITQRSDTVRFLLERGALANIVDVFPIGALSMNLEGQFMAEIGEMASAGARMVGEGNAYVKRTGFLRRTMEYAGNFGMVVILTSEDPSLSEGPAHEGFMSTSRGLKCSPVAAEEIAVARHIALAELSGTATHLAKITSAAAIRLITDAKARGLNITASVSPNNLALNEDANAGYDAMTKVWPPLRAESDRQALLKALEEGVIDVVVSDHDPHVIEEKDVEFDVASTGAASIELTWSVLNTLVAKGELSFETVIRALATAPRKILNLEGGSISVGMPADMVLLDRNAKWTVCAQDMLTGGCNTPFDRTELTGIPVLTVRRGEITWKSETLFTAR
jgi:dihydroorotase